MKKTVFILLIIHYLICNAQQNCTNNTSTDPLFPSPNINNFKKNTFDWTSRSTLPNNTIPYAIFNYYTGWQIGTIPNPFWSPSTHMHLIAAGSNSDNKPEDGWELIKQDFGYFYDNNQWNGGIMGYGLPNDPRQYPSNVTYIMLYNKYTSTLRLLFKLMADNANINTDKILVKFHLIHNNNNPNYINMQLNGIFNSYNIVQYALDQKTRVSEISIPTTIISPNIADFSYCDIDLQYDPCICFFESSLYITFHTISTGYIEMNGTLAGVSGVPILDINNNYIKGMTLNSDNFVTSIFQDPNNTPESVMQHYLNFLAYHADIANNNNNDNEFIDYKNFINMVNGFLQIVDFLDPSAAPIVETVSKVLGKTADFLDYFSVKTDKNLNNNNPYSQVNLITARMKLNGTLTYNIPIPAQEIYVQVPGSLNSNSAPEYGGANFGTPPSYSMYNEIPGLFALLKTPTLECYRDINFFDIYNPNPNSQSNWTTFSYRGIGDIQYSLNPIINQTKSKIYIRYEIDGMPIEPDVSGPGYMAYSNSHVDGGWYSYYNDYGDVVPLCFSPSNYGNIRYKYNRIVTPYYPISCNSKISVSERYWVNQQDKPDCFFIPLYANRNVTMVVLLDLYFNPDNYGKEHHVIKIQKYHCDVICSNNNFNFYDPNSTLTYATHPLDLIITNTNYSNSQEIFAFNNIKIKGNQTGNNTNIKFHAGNEISIEDESDFLGGYEFDLNIQGLPDFFNVCNEPVSNSVYNGNLFDYCKNQNLYAGNQGYQANQASSKLLANNETKTHKTNDGHLSTNQRNNILFNGIGSMLIIGPNPTSSSISIQTLDNSRIQSIRIKDLTGKILLQENFSTASNTITLDISTLSNGLYLCEVHTEHSVVTEKIVVQK
ncbi:MAG: hypothetical protein KatS3mg027_2451 [Bacteroidia bacterium]|nr:MAG: hypothetical protein KatS3mg027_2451 [Bacteroidia bacterium]